MQFPDRLKKLGITALKDRRVKDDMIEAYKVMSANLFSTVFQISRQSLWLKKTWDKQQDGTWESYSSASEWSMVEIVYRQML